MFFSRNKYCDETDHIIGFSTVNTVAAWLHMPGSFGLVPRCMEQTEQRGRGLRHDGQLVICQSTVDHFHWCEFYPKLWLLYRRHICSSKISLMLCTNHHKNQFLLIDNQKYIYSADVLAIKGYDKTFIPCGTKVSITVKTGLLDASQTAN